MLVTDRLHSNAHDSKLKHVCMLRVNTFTCTLVINANYKEQRHEKMDAFLAFVSKDALVYLLPVSHV